MVGTRVLPLVVVGVVLAVTAGCGAGSQPKPDYRPVPDETLYAQIGRLPGVMDVSLGYKDSFGSSNSYAGIVRVGARSDPGRVLDETLAILRTGRPGADYGSVSVAAGSAPGVFPDDFGLVTQDDYADRYGPQPGDGKPPAKPLTKR